MPKIVVAVLASLLCAAGLAACGDSGSTSSTTSATVPQGKLGDASDFCAVPKGPRPLFVTISQTNMTCADAVAGAQSVQQTRKFAGFSCTVTGNSSKGRASCSAATEPPQSFSASWNGDRRDPAVE